MVTRYSYSRWNTYELCPSRYDFKYVQRIKVPESEHNAVAGTAIQAVFERFYNDEIWRRGEGILPALYELLIPTWRHLYKEAYINWKNTDKLPKLDESKELEEWLNHFKFSEKYDSGSDARKEAMRKLAHLYYDSRSMIEPTLRVIKEQKLLGPYAKSEVKLQGYVGKYNIIWGKADFVVRRPSGEIVIFDGKISKDRDKYLKKDQLLFYSLAYLASNKKLPSELGWLFYRYGEFKPVFFEKDDLQVLAARILKTSKKIFKQKFERTPSQETCQFCPYKELCIKARGPLPTKKEQKTSALAILDDGNDETSF